MAHATAFLSGTVTFLFTDIEGSTRLLETLGRDRSIHLADAAAFADHEAVGVDGKRDP